MRTLLLIVCFFVVSGSSIAAQEAPASFPPIRYDEISRAILPGETPPPATDAFASDAARAQDGKIKSKMPGQPAAQQAMKPHFGFGEIFGAVFNPMGTLMNVGMQMAMGGIMGGMMGGAARGEVESGRVMRYAFYENLVRYESIADKTVTIVDAKTRNSTQIDLAKQQYKTTAMPGEPGGSAADEADTNDRGTVNVDVTTERTQGADAVIGDIDTTEYDVATTITVANVSGSCHSMKMRLETTEFVAKTMLGPSVSTGDFTSFIAAHPEMLAGAGCSGKVTSSESGPAVPEHHFMLYSRTSMSPVIPGRTDAGPQAPAMYMVVERGNVKPVSAAEAAALFSVPSGFTQQP